MSDQLSLAESAWENGFEACICYKSLCRHRPCTAAQGVFCCKECLNYEQCDSKCKRK